jgi:hypothetical protein
LHPEILTIGEVHKSQWIKSKLLSVQEAEVTKGMRV